MRNFLTLKILKSLKIFPKAYVFGLCVCFLYLSDILTTEESSNATMLMILVWQYLLSFYALLFHILLRIIAFQYQHHLFAISFAKLAMGSSEPLRCTLKIEWIFIAQKVYETLLNMMTKSKTGNFD